MTSEIMPRPKNPKLPTMLLQAARELLVEHGHPGFSLRAVSAHVGYTLTAVYRCYENRGALLRALQLHLFAELNSFTVPPPGGSAYDAVLHSGRKFVEWAVSHPAEYLFMFSNYDPELLLSDVDARTAQAGLRMLVELLRLASANGEVTIKEPEVAAVQLITSLHGVVSMSLTGRLADTPGADLLEFFDAHVEAQLRSLIPRPKP
jgi:AcrR family transcriptional regulator